MSWHSLECCAMKLTGFRGKEKKNKHVRSVVDERVPDVL
jgi:hypothetical protein